MIDISKPGDRFDDAVHAAVKSVLGGAKIRGTWRMEARDADGNVKWVEEWSNIVVNSGLDYLLDAGLGGSAQTTTWYVGLKGTGAPGAADTPGSHAAWAEITAYSQANRVTWTKNAASSGQSISNSSAPAAFGINADSTTVAGAFLASNNTKGGTTGIFYAVGNFTANRTLNNGDTLSVTATFTMADDGV